MFPLRDDNPTRYPPVVTVGIIIINALVFLWQFAGDPLENQRRLFQFAAVPFNLTHSNEEAALVFARTRLGIDVEYAAVERGTRTSARLVTQTVPSWLTLLTSMFMHGGLWHILGNMWFLWIFGNNIEDALGRVRFVLFYLLTGLAAHAGHILSNKDSLMPTVGASGAISGVLGAYLVIYPRARVLTLIPFGFSCRPCCCRRWCSCPSGSRCSSCPHSPAAKQAWRGGRTSAASPRASRWSRCSKRKSIAGARSAPGSGARDSRGSITTVGCRRDAATSSGRAVAA